MKKQKPPKEIALKIYNSLDLMANKAINHRCAGWSARDSDGGYVLPTSKEAVTWCSIGAVHNVCNSINIKDDISKRWTIDIMHKAAKSITNTNAIDLHDRNSDLVPKMFKVTKELMQKEIEEYNN